MNIVTSKQITSVSGYIYSITYIFISFFLFKCDIAAAFEPDFVFPLENVTISQGRDATFTCVVNNLGGYRVSGDSAQARVSEVKNNIH